MVTKFTGFAPFQVPLSQMTPDDFVAHNEGDDNNLVRRHSISIFLG
jgi:hypothetical protein